MRNIPRDQSTIHLCIHRPPPRHSSSDSPTRFAALDLRQLLQLDAMLAAIEDPVEGLAALSVF